MATTIGEFTDEQSKLVTDNIVAILKNTGWVCQLLEDPESNLIMGFFIAPESVVNMELEVVSGDVLRSKGLDS